MQILNVYDMIFLIREKKYQNSLAYPYTSGSESLEISSFNLEPTFCQALSSPAGTWEVKNLF